MTVSYLHLDLGLVYRNFTEFSLLREKGDIGYFVGKYEKTKGDYNNEKNKLYDKLLHFYLIFLTYHILSIKSPINTFPKDLS